MKVRWKVLALSLSISGLVLLYLPSLFLKRFLSHESFKSFAEDNVGRYLQAKVEIGKMNVGTFNEVNVSSLNVQTANKKSPVQIKIQKITLRFNPIDILLRRVERPSEIVFKAPQLLIQKGELPYDFLNALSVQGAKNQPSNLKFEGGEITSLIPYLNTTVKVHEMKGSLKIVSPTKIKLNFEFLVSGFLQGKVIAKGTIDPVHQTHQVTFDLEKMEFNDKKVALPFKSFNGRLKWVDHQIEIEKIETQVNGWDTVMTGRLKNYHLNPSLFINWALKDGPSARLECQNFQGKFSARFYYDNLLKHSLAGLSSFNQSIVSLDRAVFDDVYHGKGRLDFENGKLSFNLRHTDLPQRFSVDLDVKKTFVNLDLQFDHFYFLDLDWNIYGNFKLEPVFYAGNPRLSSMKGAFVSNLLVVDQVPFDNFRSEFLISSSGIDHFDSSWGGHFRASGDVSFKQPDLTGNISISIQEFDMKMIKKFANKPLPKEVSGVLDGKLKLIGNLLKPECLGQFTVHDGRAGSLTYDRAYLQFSGVPPVLVLNDSKAFKGRNRFDLNGSIDFSLPNIFNGILIQTPDRWVAWKGSEFDPSLGDAPEIKNKYSSFPGLGFKIESSDKDRENQTKTSASDEKFVGLGPKIKF